jgi:hypothetical protein
LAPEPTFSPTISYGLQHYCLKPFAETSF